MCVSGCYSLPNSLKVLSDCVGVGLGPRDDDAESMVVSSAFEGRKVETQTCGVSGKQTSRLERIFKQCRSWMGRSHQSMINFTFAA